MTRTTVPPISYPRSHADQIANARAGWTPEDVADYQRRVDAVAREALK